jgi:hypothetical protein
MLSKKGVRNQIKRSKQKKAEQEFNQQKNKNCPLENNKQEKTG